MVNNSSSDIYNLTSEQEEVLNNPSQDPLTLLNKLFVLSSLNSGYAFVTVITSILSVIFVLTILVAINEFVPFT